MISILRNRIRFPVNATLIRKVQQRCNSILPTCQFSSQPSISPIANRSLLSRRHPNSKWNTNKSVWKLRSFSTKTSSNAQRDASTGGIPNDGSHPTVYDDFFNLLEGGLPQAVEVKSMSPTSFTLTDGLVISQPCIFLNGGVFLWDPPHLDRNMATPGGRGWEEWKDEVWSLLSISTPKPEILIFGTGQTVLPPPAKVKNYLNSLGIQVDVQDSRNACSAFNMLSEEGRRVAVALIPAERVPTTRIEASGP